jgi:hypothetical protein
MLLFAFYTEYRSTGAAFMLGKKYSNLWVIFLLLMSAGILTACTSTETETPEPQEIRTWLLVRAPDAPLALHKPVNVKSRTEDADDYVSHVELYAVQSPAGEGELLIRSDQAPFEQTSFTASQVFVPKLPGHYVIKVVGYNKLGQKAESDYIGFDVVE